MYSMPSLFSTFTFNCSARLTLNYSSTFETESPRREFSFYQLTQNRLFFHFKMGCNEDPSTFKDFWVGLAEESIINGGGLGL